MAGVSPDVRQALQDYETVREHSLETTLTESELPPKCTMTDTSTTDTTTSVTMTSSQQSDGCHELEDHDFRLFPPPLLPSPPATDAKTTPVSFAYPSLQLATSSAESAPPVYDTRTPQSSLTSAAVTEEDLNGFKYQRVSTKM